MVDEPIGAIDRQVKAYDEAKKQDKRQQIERFFEGAVGDLEEVLPLSKIWNDRWLNATYPMKDIEKEIIERIRKTHSDIGIIVAMQLPCCDQMLSTYLDTLDMSRAMEEKHKYEQAQKDDTALAQFLDGLGEEADTSSSETSADGTMLTVTEGCNVRAEANSDSEIIGGLDEGDQVQKMGQEGDWIQIEYDGQTGYVYSGLLQ